MDSAEERTGIAEGAQPSRRTSDILKIRILSVLLALTLIAFVFYVAVTTDAFNDESPYPSETTPLRIQSWGITWDWGDADVIDLSVCRFEYDNMSYDFDIYYEDGDISGRSGLFVVGEFIDIDDFVVPGTLEEADGLSHLSWVSFWEDGVEMDVMVCYFVSDHTDSLEFNRGDTISFVRLVYADGMLSATGFQEGATYEISLIVFEDAEQAEEGYGFAVQDADLYSWIDHGAVDNPLS